MPILNEFTSHDDCSACSVDLDLSQCSLSRPSTENELPHWRLVTSLTNFELLSRFKAKLASKGNAQLFQGKVNLINKRSSKLFLIILVNYSEPICFRRNFSSENDLFDVDNWTKNGRLF